LSAVAPVATPPARQIAAVVIGNALEFYDFVAYAFFAVQIGHAFFPSHNPSSSLLMSLATFGAGFLMRPIGGIVIGRLGDRIGRKPAMLLSFGCMGAAMIGLAITPTYAAIGVLAPILVIVFRLLQGFALGGEVGPSTAFLMEAAPPGRRGFYVSMQVASQGAAILFAGLTGVVLARTLDDAALLEWGWRVPFLLGTLIVPFGLYVRRRLPETLERHGSRQTAGPGVLASGERARLWRTALLGLAILSSGTIATYTLAYLTTYATTTLKLRTDIAFGATVVMGLADICIAPLSGCISDRHGRRVTMLTAWSLLFVAVLPAFLVLTRVPASTTLLLATAVLATLRSFMLAPALAWLSESLPATSRSGTIAITYAVAVALFGGTAQFVVAWLIVVTGNPLAPAWYMLVAVGVGVVAMASVNETVPSGARTSQCSETV
jgi:MFS family permease